MLTEIFFNDNISNGPIIRQLLKRGYHMLNKMNRMSLVEQIAVQMEELIEAGHWQVGEKIPAETTLMIDFDVSRNTLREAIRALVHAGLLETKQGSGTQVRASNSMGVMLRRYSKKASLLEILDVRIALEKQAAILAASHRTDKSLLKLKHNINACRKAVANDSLQDFIKADIEFHKSVVEASENQLLIDLYNPLADMIYDFIENIMTSGAAIDQEEALHTELFKAIESKNQLAAGNYIETYIEKLRYDVERTLED